ncbi:hypothetical protein [Dictyobacter arantiisoli]|uniref:SprT-like domain-containing protein n=1 Tax=Dictyobacter arantiisoli TaxID=2014874 RepID=A0A5A5T681_9CHLR|nr:hypothetical protein [Dictyobacter arantiisoli]GCF06696.1 hypothetical protein KDI_02600 [Dictyobacter arantiisoli]
MATKDKLTRLRSQPTPPPVQIEPFIAGESALIKVWFVHYWQKLSIPDVEWPLLAATQNRQEYTRWTGKRLNAMALGCYCYLPASTDPIPARLQATMPKFEPLPHRHLIFIEPTLQPLSTEVTIAHELIHLSDRVQGSPRRHQHHGYDSIAVDEAAITGRSVEDLRALLHMESLNLERIRRERRPIRYLYQCSHCGKQYPRTRRYSQAVSCSSCDKNYNPRFSLSLLPLASQKG